MNEDKKKTILLEKAERKAAFYSKKYKDQMSLLESKSSPLARSRSITSYDRYALGKQLEAFDGMRQMLEYDGSINQLGVVPKIAYDVIAITYAASILPILASVQPVEEQQGLVYFKQIKAWDTRGNFTANDTMLDPRTGLVTPQGYANNTVSAETCATGPGATFTFTTTQLPLRGSMYFYVGATPVTVYANDDSAGVISGVGMSGTVNYSTGLVSLTVAVALVGETIYANYSQNYEASTDIPQIQSQFASTTVTAKIYALKTTVGLMETYSLKKRFGYVAEEEMAKDLVSEINAELGGDMIRLMAAAAVGITTFNTVPGAGVSWFEHKQQLVDKIFADAGAVLLNNAGRGTVNLMVAGYKAAGTLSTLPGFELVTDGNSIGAHLFGTLKGVPVVRVPETAVLDDSTIICAYKGTSPFEAPMVYAPYMPLTVTGLLPMSPNPLMSQRAAAVWAGVQILIQNFITKVVLTY